MSMHLQREIDRLKKKILTECTVVEELVRKAVVSVENRDGAMARSVADADPEIDRMELEIEEDCLKILALHQPVAVDLRFIVAVLKMNNDLERIGDLAVNIAERSCYLAEKIDTNVSKLNFPRMAEKVTLMLKKSLDSLVNLDEKLAFEVCSSDDEVDGLNREMYGLIDTCIRNEPGRTDCWLQLMSISRYLERIADHATNIAEDVLYMVKGVIARHRAESMNPLTEIPAGKSNPVR